LAFYNSNRKYYYKKYKTFHPLYNNNSNNDRNRSIPYDPPSGKYYETANYIRREGRYPSERYFTTIPPTYVGKYIRHEQYGYGDGGRHYAIFDNSGVEITVTYNYEGTTCFREVIKSKL
jgi:hypothetical protein